MLKTIYISILFIIISWMSRAQCNIYGKITDHNTGAPLEYSNIIIKELKKGTTTDMLGKFSFKNIPPGSYELRVSFIGYQTKKISFLIADQKQHHLNIELSPLHINLKPATVTATRYSTVIETVPAAATVLGKEELSEYPITNFDNLLQTASNVFVNRSSGIFSRNSSVVMRGLNSSAHTLILYDGIPLNHSAGGTINWHLIQPENIERVEIIKGPASALYGMNAMGGVINIITKNHDQKFGGEAMLQGGTYNTLGGSLLLNGNKITNNKGLYWAVNGSYRQGDGYINEPLDSREWYHTELSLMEYDAGLKTGYQFNEKESIEFQHHFYQDKRGQGKTVVEEDGSFDSYTTNLSLLKYQNALGKSMLTAKVFNQYEIFYRQAESMSSTSKYKLYHQEDHKNDFGIWLSATTPVKKKHQLIYGIDFKTGNVNSETIYRTSTDILDYGGVLNYYGLFIQDEINFFKDKVKFVIGGRFDQAFYKNGFLDVIDPTSNTGFTAGYEDKFADNNWTNFSPKVAVQYNLTPKAHMYLSFSSGFLPPKLDDLSKSGKISKGFKLANPELQPETLNNYEVGLKLFPANNVSLNTAFYYSRGHDFQYLVGTGDSVDTGGDALKPVLRRENITDVKIIGGETDLTWAINSNLTFRTNYTYNYSEIVTYTPPDPEVNKDITGKHLIEVPEHQFYAGIFWKNKIINTFISFNYVGEQWMDDDNTTTIAPFSLTDVTLSKTFRKKIKTSLIVQNIFDIDYLDRKERLSTGRFILLKINYKI